MHHLNSFSHLEPFGIVFLTGEACAQNFRVLCDLTASGKRVVEKALGCEITSEPWNNGRESNPHVASIMVSRHLFPQIAVYCLLERCAFVVLAKDGAVFGFKDQQDLDVYRAYLKDDIERIFKGTGCGVEETRNRHAMSGRLV